MSLVNGADVPAYELFGRAKEVTEGSEGLVREAQMLPINAEAFARLHAENPAVWRLVLPAPYSLSLDLYSHHPFDTDAKILTSDGRTFLPDPDNRYYRGMVTGDPNSLAVVSVFRDRISVLYADAGGNRRFRQQPDGTYISWRDQDILVPRKLDCHTTDAGAGLEPGETGGGSRNVTGNCVQVFVVCDYKSYQDNGSSVPNTEEWVGELWNEVTTLYNNEQIPVAVSQILVYTSTDPYASLNSTSAVLSAFANYIATATYTGRLAHLLSTRSLGGGIAYLNTLCATNGNQTAFSASLSTNIIAYPTYSWTVEVVTHEMGHNMGSPHTHACSWNGNNTAIDGCGPAAGYSEGSCPTAPLPPAGGGTIMSYCHLVSGVGIGFTNGFGPQPGDLIRNKYNTASCNTGTCSLPACVAMTLPTPNSNTADVNTNIVWGSSPGATGYRITIGTTPTNGSIANNVDVGPATFYDIPVTLAYTTLYYVKITPYNNLGDATSCTTYQFTTETNTTPLCTSITVPLPGASGVGVDVVIQWTHSVGNQTGYKISIGTTPGGTDIANNVNVGNVTTYDHPTSFPYATTLHVRITPYNGNGDVSNCATQSFTTIVPVSGDFCTTAIDLPCSNSLTGNTAQALPDSAPTCSGLPVDAPGIWYKFTGNGQNAIITTCNQFGYDTQLHAYSGSCTGLTCVASNDDFCTQGSSITFATTNGTQYYVLVNGYGGSIGSYTVSRSCYSGPLYCLSQSNNASLEWISNVTVGSFSKTSGSAKYSDFTTDTVTVSRGLTYTLSLSPAYAGSTRNEYFRVWIDFNKDGDFVDAGEQVFSGGPYTATVNSTLQIPVTVASGLTRMRVSMRYNSLPSPCSFPGTDGSGYSHGEVEDYTIRIKCNTVTTTADSGNGSLRNVSLCVDDGEDVLFASSLNNQTITVTLGEITVDGIWHWKATVGSNITIQASNITRILNVPAGKTMEIENLKLVGGTAASGGAVINAGTLLLRDSTLKAAAGNTGTVLANTGLLQTIGTSTIMY